MDETDQTDRTAELASVLGLSALAFARLFGTGWGEPPGHVTQDFDSEPPDGLKPEATPWFLSGESPQLMIRVFDHGVFLARPEGSSSAGTHDLVYRPADGRNFGLHELGAPEAKEHVRDLLRRRRSTFRYCRYCRRVTPAELRIGDSCMECATAWEGIVY
jgi:hypothetical protein